MIFFIFKDGSGENMIKLSKKSTTVVILCILACPILLSELTNGSDKHGFFTLSVVDVANIENTNSTLSNAHSYLEDIIPHILSNEEIKEWLKHEDVQQTLSLELTEQATTVPQIPGSLLELNDSLEQITGQANYYPINQTLEIPLSLFVQNVDPNFAFFQKIGDNDVKIPFHLAGLWFSNSTFNTDSHQPMFLQGTFELNQYTDQFEELLSVRQARAYDPMWISLMSYEVQFHHPLENKEHWGSFMKLFIAKEGEQFHYLLGTDPTLDSYTGAILPTYSQLNISFFPSEQSEQQTNPISIPVKRTLGQGYDIQTTLTLSPTLKLRLEQAIEYDSFILFTSTLDKKLEHELLLSANFLWSDGSHTYRAESMGLTIDDKILFISYDPPRLNALAQIELEEFEALSTFDQQVSIPLDLIEEGEIMTFLGQSLTVAEIHDQAGDYFPKLKMTMNDNQTKKSFLGDFNVSYKHPLDFYMVATSKDDPTFSFFMKPQYDELIIKDNGYESLLNFDLGRHRFIGEFFYTLNIEDINFDDYNYVLYLPTAQSEIKLKGKTIPLQLNKNEHIYSPR